jgi:hypothetical protein
MGCMVSQPSTTGGIRLHPDFWAVTGDPWYPGYKTLIVAPLPSVERVARVVRSMGGRIGNHKLLLELSHDSVVRTWF